MILDKIAENASEINFIKFLSILKTITFSVNNLK